MIQTTATAFGLEQAPVCVLTPASQRYPMQAAQQEVWLSSQQSDAANCAYNEIATLTIDGLLHRSSLDSAIQTVVQRHGSLRATFDRYGQEVVEQPFRPLNVEIIDWRQEDQQHNNQQRDNQQQKNQCLLLRRQLIEQLGSTPFDLQQGPLFRVILQIESDAKHFLTIIAHHLVLDGWSLGLIVQELGRFYDQFKNGDDMQATAAATAAPAYAEYTKAVQQHTDSESGRRELTYWIDQFVEGAPTLDLPLSGNRRSLRTYSASRIEHTLPAALVKRVRSLGAKNGCSLYNSMLATFQAFVARLCQTQDVVLAIPTAGQSALDFPGLVGHCVHTLPVRLHIDNRSSFQEHLKQSRSALLSALDHQRLSFGTLLQHLKAPRDPSRPPLCAISFNLDPAIDIKQCGFTGLDVSLQVEPRSYENFEWFVNGIVHADQSIELQVQFNTDLFQSTLIQYYMEGFQAYLEYLVEHPEAKLREVPMMSLAQRQTMLVEWNATQLPYPLESNLPAEFARQVQRTPDNVAVRADGEELTFRELDSQSSRFAQCLTQHGLKNGDLVGICAHRSARLVVQLLGILKAGLGYVPLDPQYPAERLCTMCTDSQLKLVVTEKELTNIVSGFGKPMLVFDDYQLVDQVTANGSTSGSTRDLNDSTASIVPSDICYVIYTSGSTGKPKGVMVPHGAVVNFLYSMKEQPGYAADDRLLAVTTLSFDIAVLELYLPLVFGGTVVIADWATANDGKKLIAALEREEIDMMQATPATWRMLIASGWSGKKDLKILCGGEPLTRGLVESLLPRCGELWNMYGPTETTVWSTVYRITSADSPILIGRPIGNTQIYLLDAQGQEVPVGVEGEVMIGGAGVTLGYLNRPELTDERFIDNPYFNPFVDYVNHRLYKTGDLAVVRLDGCIEYRRRNDKQVKLRGFRIELGEIESAIRGFSGIDQVVAIVRSDQPDDARLVAYLTVKRVPLLGQLRQQLAERLREELRRTLPHYMIPQNFVVLDAMPLTSNGKIDVQSLPAPDTQSHSASANDSATALCQTRAEKYLEGVWKAVLRLDTIYRDDNFFDLGGHSLLVIQAINQVETTTGLRLRPHEFLLGTLEQLAAQLDGFTELSAFESATEQPATTPTPTSTAIDVHEVRTAESALPIAKSPFDCLRRFWRQLS